MTRLDRLARSTRDLLSIVDVLEAKGAQLKSLSEAWADTTKPTGKLILDLSRFRGAPVAHLSDLSFEG